MNDRLIEKESKTKYLILILAGIVLVGFIIYPYVPGILGDIYNWAESIGPIWAWIGIIGACVWFAFKSFTK